MDIAVAGAGVMGQHHARILQELGHRLVGVIDPDQEAAWKAAGDACSTFEDLRSFLDAGIGDGLIVAAPTRFHGPTAEAALQAGLHVLVEKPLAATVPEAASMVEAARKAGRTLAVGHVERFNPCLDLVRDALRDAGEPFAFSSIRTSPLPTRIRDEGCILDIGIHDIDLSLALLPKGPAWASCAGDAENEFEQHASILMGGQKTERSIQVGWRGPPKVRSIRVSVEGRHVEADLFGRRVRVIDDAGVHEAVKAPEANPLALEIQDFVTACEEGRRPMVDGTGGLRALQVAETAIKALRLGTQETIP